MNFVRNCAERRSCRVRALRNLRCAEQCVCLTASPSRLLSELSARPSTSRALPRTRPPQPALDGGGARPLPPVARSGMRHAHDRHHRLAVSTTHQSHFHIANQAAASSVVCATNMLSSSSQIFKSPDFVVVLASTTPSYGAKFGDPHNTPTTETSRSKQQSSGAAVRLSMKSGQIVKSRQ